MEISELVDIVFSLLLMIMFVRVALTWFPNIDWYTQPFKILKAIADPIFEPFKRIIPPIAGLDLSPIVAFLLVSFARSAITSFLASNGL